MRLACLLLVLAACAHDVRAHYPALVPAPPDDPPGSVTFVFTTAASDVTIAVNGKLVVDDVHTGRVHIDGLPPGNNDVVVAIGPQEKAMTIWIYAGTETVVPLGSPGESQPAGWRAAFVSLAGVALYALLLR